MTGENTLYYGDNLDVLRRHVRDESVDLVYLDPPFKSDRDYNVLFQERDGTRAAAQIKAFEDTWEWNAESAAAYQEVVEAGGDVANAMRAFRMMLGDTDMLAYLSMMAPRLVELKRVLKESGTIYLHCDATASAHLRLLMDAVFGSQNFLNEIVWHYQTSSGAPRKWLHRNHDVILRYAAVRPDLVTWHHPRLPWPETTLRKWQRDEEGRIYRVQNKFGGKRYYVDPAGKLDDDVWDITLSSRTHERLGYPTQKPEALLEKIILASSDEGEVVLDPFAGCGTATVVAQRLNRRWIGIDITHLAVGLIKHRLVDTFGPEVAATYRVVGEPTTVEDAAVLARDDPFQFQAWALGLVGARVSTSDRRGGDRGIDGRLYFHDGTGDTKQIVLSVKAGHLVPTYLRDLRGVIDREEAQIGVLISFEDPTSGMRGEAASAGFYDSPWGRHPRLQLLTVGQLLDGRTIDYPHVTGANVTLRRASRAASISPSVQTSLFAAAAAPAAADAGEGDDDDDDMPFEDDDQ